MPRAFEKIFSKHCYPFLEKNRLNRSWTLEIFVLQILGIYPPTIKRTEKHHISTILFSLLKVYWIIINGSFIVMDLYNFVEYRTKKSFILLIVRINVILLRLITPKRLRNVLKLLRRNNYFNKRTPNRTFTVSLRLIGFFVVLAYVINSVKLIYKWRSYASLFHVEAVSLNVRMYLEPALYLAYIGAMTQNIFLPYFTMRLCCFLVMLQHEKLEQERCKIKRKLDSGLSTEAIIRSGSIIQKVTTVVKDSNDILSPVLFYLTYFWFINNFYNVNKYFDFTVNSDFLSSFLATITIVGHYGQYSYLAYLVNETENKYKKIVMVLTKSGEDKIMFSFQNNCIKFHLLMRTISHLSNKMSIYPLGIFKLSTKVILCTGSILVTYNTILIQTVSDKL